MAPSLAFALGRPLLPEASLVPSSPAGSVSSRPQRPRAPQASADGQPRKQEGAGVAHLRLLGMVGGVTAAGRALAAGRMRKAGAVPLVLRRQRGQKKNKQEAETLGYWEPESQPGGEEPLGYWVPLDPSEPPKEAPAAPPKGGSAEPLGYWDPRYEAGVTEPLGYWDPLSLSKSVDAAKAPADAAKTPVAEAKAPADAAKTPVAEAKRPEKETFKKYRAAEVKHGRVAMLAAVGAIAQHFLRIPGFEGVPSGVNAVFTPPGSYGLILLTALAGGVELGLWTDSTAEEPGNFGDPAGVGMDSAEMRDRELNNGRVAMFAAIGIVAAELFTGRDAVQQLSF